MTCVITAFSLLMVIASILISESKGDRTWSSTSYEYSTIIIIIFIYVKFIVTVAEVGINIATGNYGKQAATKTERTDKSSADSFRYTYKDKQGSDIQESNISNMKKPQVQGPTAPKKTEL